MITNFEPTQEMYKEYAFGKKIDFSILDENFHAPLKAYLKTRTRIQDSKIEAILLIEREIITVINFFKGEKYLGNPLTTSNVYQALLRLSEIAIESNNTRSFRFFNNINNTGLYSTTVNIIQNILFFINHHTPADFSDINIIAKKDKNIDPTIKKLLNEPLKDKTIDLLCELIDIELSRFNTKQHQPGAN